VKIFDVKFIESSPICNHNTSTVSDILIKGYKDEDFNQVWELHEMALKDTDAFVLGHGEWDKDLKNILEIYHNNRGAFVVAEYDGHIIGMGALRNVSRDTAEIKRMRVLPERQGEGLGTKLLHLLENEAKKLNYKKLILDTSVRQKAAIHLYKKHGYIEYKRGMLGGLETIFMEKLIQ